LEEGEEEKPDGTSSSETKESNVPFFHHSSPFIYWTKDILKEN
jgi:hypothetical protein